MSRTRVKYNAMTGESQYKSYEGYEDLEDFRVQSLESLVQEYRSILHQGVISSATGEEVTYGYTPDDQMNYSKLANILSLTSTDTITLGTVSHGIIEMTRDEYINFMSDAKEFEMTMYHKRKLYEHQIQTATSVEEINTLTFDWV